MAKFASSDLDMKGHQERRYEFLNSEPNNTTNFSVTSPILRYTQHYPIH